MGIMTTILVIIIIIITIILITTIGFGAQGRSEFSATVSHPKVQTLSNRTLKGQGGTHTTGNHRGEGGYQGVGGWGGGGPSSAAPYIYSLYYSNYLSPYISGEIMLEPKTLKPKRPGFIVKDIWVS